MSTAVSGAEFKNQLRGGATKLGLFLNSHSPTVAEQLAHSGYDWMLVDTQHGPMGYEKLSAMLAAIANGGGTSLVRVGGYADRAGIQQSLDMGADGVLVPYINTADEARAAISCCRYPTAGTRSVYFPQRSMNKGGLLGYAGAANDNVIVALQVETADCIKNIDEIAAVPGVDMLFLGQNDLCMSMGLYEKYQFPDMYTSPGTGRRDQHADRRRSAAQHHPRHLLIRNVAGRRVHRQGIPVHQRRQRSPPHPDPGGCVREGCREHHARQGQGLGAASVSVDLASAWSRKPSSLCRPAWLVGERLADSTPRRGTRRQNECSCHRRRWTVISLGPRP